MNDQEAHDFYASPANLMPAGPARRRRRPILTAMTAVRFAPEVIDEVKSVAFAEGVTVGAWIRRLVDGVLRDRRGMAWLDEHRHELEIVPGSGRLGTPRSLPSTLSVLPRGGRMFACQHLSVGNVAAASCVICGPLRAVA